MFMEAVDTLNLPFVPKMLALSYGECLSAANS